MMNLKEIREAYESLSETLSSVVRQINFAGIAIVWIFVDNDKKTIDQLLLNSCLFVVVSILIDVLQYLVSTIIWYIVYAWNHKKGEKDELCEVRDSEWINFIPWVCLYAKCLLTCIGYIYILRFFIAQFKL